MATSSLKTKAVCSGFKVNPSANLTSWVPLSRSHGPCSAEAAHFADNTPSVVDMLREDQHRADYIQRKLSGNGPQDSGRPVASSRTTRFDHEFHVKANFGTPRKKHDSQLSIEPAATGGRLLPGVKQTLVLDTASDVPWVQCAPCPVPPCHPQTDVLYDPTKSGTSAAFSCNSPTCRQLGPYANGCFNSQCQYRVQYPDGSSTMGTYISDVLTLTPTAVISKFQFGCSHAEKGSFSNKASGIMALGGGPQSLVSQTAGTYGDAFSYCLPPPSYYGFFTLGVPRVMSSRFVVTPMLRNKQVPTFYIVRLQAITVAGQRLNVPPTVFAAGSVMDSRTIITRLPPTAYQALRSAFRDNMKMYRAAAPKGHLDTCFDFTGVRSIRLPTIALVFERNAAVELDPSGILFNDCLAFAPNSDDRVPGIIGNVQQQTLEVLYDVVGETVGFRRGAC